MSNNLLLHRYYWPKRHTKQVPGEQHSSNYRSANGLCLHKLLWGDDPGQKINTHTTAHPFLPCQWHPGDKEQSKETCGSSKDSLTGEGKRGHTTPKAASDSKSLPISHKCGYPSKQQPPWKTLTHPHILLLLPPVSIAKSAVIAISHPNFFPTYFLTEFEGRQRLCAVQALFSNSQLVHYQHCFSRVSKTQYSTVLWKKLTTSQLDTVQLFCKKVGCQDRQLEKESNLDNMDSFRSNKS